MDTSVSNAVPPAISEVEIPPQMFFDAKDYAPHAKPRTKPTKDQVNVVRARGELLGDVHRIHERLAVAIKHIRVADACGMATASIDILLTTAEDFMSTVQRLAKTADNAETRYEQAIEQGPSEQGNDTLTPHLEGVISTVPVSSSLQKFGPTISPAVLAEASRRINDAHAALGGRRMGDGGR